MSLQACANWYVFVEGTLRNHDWDNGGNGGHQLRGMDITWPVANLATHCYIARSVYVNHIHHKCKQHDT